MDEMRRRHSISESITIDDGGSFFHVVADRKARVVRVYLSRRAFVSGFEAFATGSTDVWLRDQARRSAVREPLLLRESYKKIFFGLNTSSESHKTMRAKCCRGRKAARLRAAREAGPKTKVATDEDERVSPDDGTAVLVERADGTYVFIGFQHLIHFERAAADPSPIRRFFVYFDRGSWPHPVGLSDKTVYDFLSFSDCADAKHGATHAIEDMDDDFLKAVKRDSFVDVVPSLKYDDDDDDRKAAADDRRYKCDRRRTHGLRVLHVFPDPRAFPKGIIEYAHKARGLCTYEEPDGTCST